MKASTAAWFVVAAHMATCSGVGTQLETQWRLYMVYGVSVPLREGGREQVSHVMLLRAVTCMNAVD